MAKYVRQPTPEEMASLTEYARLDDTFSRTRASAILLSVEGKGTSDIADAVGLSVRQVRTIIDSFNKHGMEVLRKRKSSGRPRVLTDRQGEALRELIDRRPREFGIERDNWTLESLVATLISESVCDSVSTYTIQREIKRCGIDWSEVKFGGVVRIPTVSPNDNTDGTPIGNRRMMTAPGVPATRCGLYADRMRLCQNSVYDL